MCGIAGIINQDNKPVDRDLLISMRDVLSHRGPDDSGIWLGGNVGLGHRRLSIIDFSQAGHQPMHNEDKTIWLVFNGEIYNYIEIKGELIKRGHRFASHTDAEVIIHAYEDAGEDCVKLFNGMWAFVIWDVKDKKLFASRDRFGEKPFYYYDNGGSFYFSSEINAFFVIPSFKKDINQKAAFLYLVYNQTDAEEETFFQGIRQLLPAHNLVFKERRLRIYKYWDIDGQKAVKYKGDEDYFAHFRDIFKDAVKIRLRSDVEVGTSLSGGLDSSSIISMIKYIDSHQEASLGQKSYSAVFPGSKDDESGWVRLLSRRFNINSFFVKPDTDGLVKDLRQLILHQAEPFFSPNVYLQWEVMKSALHNNTTVLLDGQGADEILAGYLPYFSIFYIGLVKQFRFCRLTVELGKFMSRHNLNIANFFNKAALNDTFIEVVLRRKYNYLKRDFLSRHFTDRPAVRVNKHKSALKNALYFSLTESSLPYLLRYADRNSMAFSREIRLPFLDYRLVEFIFAIPDNFMIRDGQTKYILRKSMESIVPQETLNRQDKIGYAFPPESWFNMRMKKLIEETISGVDGNNPFFIPDKLNTYWRFYLNSNKDYLNTREIWKIFNILVWEKLIIKGQDIL